MSVKVTTPPSGFTRHVTLAVRVTVTGVAPELKLELRVVAVGAGRTLSVPVLLLASKFPCAA